MTSFKKIICSAIIGVMPILSMALKIEGEWREGELLMGNVSPQSTVFLNNEPITVGDDGLFIIGLDRDTDEQVSLTIIDGNGSASSYTYKVASREYKIQAVDGIAKSIMEPSDADLKRAIKESIAIKKSRSLISERRDFLNPFIIPTTGFTTGVYGSQRIYNGKPGRPHYGWDIAAAVGTKVKAPNSGMVIFSQLDTFYSGGLIIIDHGYHLSSSFLHLSEIYVKVGDTIQQGDVIGAVGATGRVTGPHLDWRINWGKSYIDPQRLTYHN